MATKKNETKNTAAQQIQENQVTQTEEQNQNAENQSAENAQTEKMQGEQVQNQETQKENEMQKKELIAFHELAAKYRLPSWQSAAILKLLDKEDDAHLAEDEFTAALEKLYNRKMGA